MSKIQYINNEHVHVRLNSTWALRNSVYNNNNDNINNNNNNNNNNSNKLWTLNFE